MLMDEIIYWRQKEDARWTRKSEGIESTVMKLGEPDASGPKDHLSDQMKNLL